MAAPKRTKAEIEKDRAEIARLYLKGWTQAAIAAHLGMTQQMVSYDLQVIYEDWRESALVDIDAAKARELAKIDELERTYWDEWAASRKPFESETTKGVQHVPNPQGNAPARGASRAEKITRKEQRLGDPRYLAGIQWCITRRCAILGIDAPTAIRHSGEVASTMKHSGKVDLGIDGDEYITRVLDILADAGAALDGGAVDRPGAPETKPAVHPRNPDA